MSDAPAGRWYLERICLGGKNDRRRAYVLDVAGQLNLPLSGELYDWMLSVVEGTEPFDRSAARAVGLPETATMRFVAECPVFGEPTPEVIRINLPLADGIRFVVDNILRRLVASERWSPDVSFRFDAERSPVGLEMLRIIQSPAIPIASGDLERWYTGKEKKRWIVWPRYGDVVELSQPGCASDKPDPPGENRRFRLLYKKRKKAVKASA